MSESSPIQTSKSNPLLILLSIKKFPKLFKKFSKIFKKVEANFLTGILIGALFSLIVNIITNQVGEIIARQKSLEALEIEINDHHLTSANMIDNVNKGDYKKSKTYFYTVHRYADHIWNSLGSTTFFYSLPPKTQGLLISYYSNIINGANNALANNDQIVNKYQTEWVVCSFGGGNCSKESNTLNSVIDFYYLQQSNWGVLTDKYDYDISQEFHPTRDRLNDPLLSFLMGKQAIVALSLPWKPAK